MITGVQPKLLVSFDENGNMLLDENQAELMGLVEKQFNWKLVRERDGYVIFKTTNSVYELFNLNDNSRN